MQWLIFLFSLLFIIIFHECGHFFVARFFRVAIARFSIGFGKPLYRRVSTKHATEFVLSPILLGGYVQFSEKKHLDELTFETLARWKKILILLAGPMANILLALILMTVVFKMDVYEPIAIVGELQSDSFLQQQGIPQGAKVLRCNDNRVKSWSDVMDHWQVQGKNSLVFQINGHDKTMQVFVPEFFKQDDLFQALGFSPYIYPLPAIIDGFTKDSKAYAQGLMIGDEILELNHQKVHSLQDVSLFLKDYPDQKIKIKIKRKKEILHLSIKLGHQKQGKFRIGFLGIRALPFSQFPQWYEKKQYSWFEATVKSLKWIKKILHWQLTSMGKGVEVSGPVGMARAAHDAWVLSFKAYLLFLVWLNMGVGILNLIPIPILDGGQCLLLVIGKWIPAIEKEKNKKLILTLSLIMLCAMLLLGILHDWLE